MDKEIRRRERNREKKRERRRRKKKEEDEMLLERIWLNTVEIKDRDGTLITRQVSLPQKVAQVTSAATGPLQTSQEAMSSLIPQRN